MGWLFGKPQSTQAKSSTKIGQGLEALESRTVLSGGGVGSLQSTLTGTAGAFLIDVSDSMNSFHNLDVNRDGVLNDFDDVNWDGIKGTSLDESLYAIIELIEQRQMPDQLTLVLFGADAKPLDMSPEAGFQAVGPTYADANFNGVFDSIDMLRSIRVGGGGLFSQTNVDPSRTFYDAPLDALVAIQDAYPNVTFRVNLTNTPGTLPVTNPDPGVGTLIDNDVDPSTVGFFSMLVLDGGYSNLANVTAQGQNQLFTQSNFLFDFINGVNVAGAGAVPLGLTNVTEAAARDASGDDIVTSSGNFQGQNGQVNWTVRTSIADGSTTIVNTVTFESASPFGDLQFGNYLDEDVGPNFDDDILYTVGTPGQADFAAFKLDNAERVGFSQAGVYTPDGTQLINATYDGWAADEYDDLLIDLGNGTATFSIPGNINTTNLPPFNDPSLGLVYGPEDVTTAFVWTVDPTAFSATITTFLNLVPTNPVISFGAGLMTDGSGLLSTSATVLNALAARDLPVSTFLAGNYFEVGSLRSVERIALGTGGEIVVPTTPVIVDNASISPTVPPGIASSPIYQIQQLDADLAVTATEYRSSVATQVALVQGSAATGSTGGSIAPEVNVPTETVEETEETTEETVAEIEVEVPTDLVDDSEPPIDESEDPLPVTPAV